MRIGNLLCWAALGYAGYKAYQWYKEKQGGQGKFVQPLPPGAKPTGRVQTTEGAQPGGIETLGYRLRNFAEVVYADGQREWRELIK